MVIYSHGWGQEEEDGSLLGKIGMHGPLRGQSSSLGTTMGAGLEDVGVGGASICALPNQFPQCGSSQPGPV